MGKWSQIWSRWTGRGESSASGGGSEAERGDSWRAPVSRRLKTYSAENGFAYQYVSIGSRETGSGLEFGFDISADRVSWGQVVVELTYPVLEEAAGRIGRELSSSERFGVAKIGMLRELDRREGGGIPPNKVKVDSTELASILEFLGVS
jgi:hypothetical protein